MPWIEVSETLLLHAETGATFTSEINVDDPDLRRIVHKAPGRPDLLIVIGSPPQCHKTWLRLKTILDTLALHEP